jgi:quercetin dioxygenase-like cupin family protein
MSGTAVSAAGPFPRRVPKPWGHELIWAVTDHYVGKILVIETGRRLSLQYHDVKDEWIYVLSGRLRLILEAPGGELTERILEPGDGAHVERGRRHRYEAIERAELVEVSTPELGDVVRLDDDFGREGTSAP